MANTDDSTIISREEARTLGLKRYFTGRACKYGHTAQREVSNTGCVICRLKIYNDRGRIAAYARKYRLKNKDAIESYRKKWSDSSSGRRYNKMYYIKYSRQHPEKINAKSRKYKCEKIQRTPVWADLKKIEEIYAECSRVSKITGVKHHVDHIIPLQGKMVCGLHVHNNLQIITAKENHKKLNKLLPEFSS